MNTTEVNGKTRPNTLGAFNALSREAIEALPAAVYMTDAEGRLTFYNEAAAALWGCRPELGETKFCGSWKLYWPDGTRLPHDQCPMAMALHQGRPIRGMEAVAERPDGTRIPFIPYPTPLFDESGRLTGAVNMLVDISERKRAEADLAERQAQLAVFVEHAPAAIAMFDREMRYLAVSRRFVVDFRLPQTAQLIGRSHYEIFPDIPQRWRDVHARVLAGEELSQEEDQFARQDGRIDWVRWSMVPWRRADGNIGGALLFSEVRTEQVEARRALIDSEARFRATFENAAVGVVLVGPDGSILRANNSFARMLGYSVEELKARTFQDLTHPDDLATNLSVLNKTLVGEADSYSIEKRYVRKDGGIVWASLTVGCVRKTDGGVDYFVSVVQDITDRKRAEARLAERNAQLDLAGKIARIGSFMYDDGTRKLQLSPGCAAIYGLPEGTLEISREDWRALVHPDDLPRLDAVARRAFTNGEREFVLEFRIFRHGQVRWIESRVLISYNEAGKPVRRIGAEIDVTERKQAEQALAERNIQLALAAKAGLVGTYAYDTDTEIMQISDGYAAIHGFPEGTTEIARSECLAGVHPDDLGRVEQFRSEAFRERRREYNVEYRIIRPGGELRWVETRCFLSFTDRGHPHRVVGVSIDITERKRAVDRLQESERKLRDLLGALPAAIYVTDAAGHITYCNQSAVDLWGSEPKLGRDKWSELVKYRHADGSPMALADCPTEVALKQGRIVREKEAIIERKDGTRIPIIPYPTPLRDETGTIVGVVNMTVDISERKKAELILADQTTQLALAGKAGLVGSFAYDIDTERMQISAGYAAIHGFPDGTTEIARSEWQLGVHPEDRVRWEALRSRAYRERWDEYSGEYRIVRSGGEIRWIEARVFVSYDGDGRPRRAVGVDIDVTERKQAEEHLQALNAELDHRVKNVLATASAVAAQTMNASSSLEHFVSAFDGRLRSMAQTHELLSERLWRGIPLAELLRRELAPYAGGNNTEIGGPEVILTAEAGQTLAMVFHELATNAAKHGAFSSREGKVSVDWRRQLNGTHVPGWSLNGERLAAPPPKLSAKPAMGSASSASLSPMNSQVRSITCSRPREHAVNWNFQVVGSTQAVQLNALSIGGTRRLRARRHQVRNPCSVCCSA